MGVALIRESARNELNEMRRQLRMGADVDYVDMKMIGGVDMSFTPLIMASNFGHVPAVTLLIESGADVNMPEPCGGLTALHASAQQGNVPVMQLLISKGARIDASCKLGRTPLHGAAVKGQKEAATTS